MKLTARVATTADVAALAQLLSDGAVTVQHERGGAIFVSREVLPTPFDEQLPALLAEADAFVAVGAVDGVTLGVALARLERLRDDTVLARLEYLWVEPEAREVGLGSELIDLVQKWALGAGARRLDAYALPGNRQAKNFLETAGFSARLIVMHRTLGEPEH